MWNFNLLDKTWKPKIWAAAVWDLIEIHWAGSLSKVDITWLSKVHVKIETVVVTWDEISITVRPSAAPWDDASDINHFYTKNTTNTFTLSKEINALGLPVVAFHTDWRNLEYNWIQWVTWMWIEVVGANAWQRYDVWSHILSDIL